MPGNISAIWVKISTRGRKPLVIVGIYREFHHLLQPSPNNTDEWPQQVTRWNTTLNNWKKATKDSKSIVFGDLNIDFLRWNTPEYRLKKIGSNDKKCILKPKVFVN